MNVLTHARKSTARTWLLAAVAVILASLLALSLQTIQASARTNTFNVAVKHAIDGTALGLSEELPVDVMVYKDGALLTTLRLEFQDVIRAELPAGEYLIMVESLEAGPLPSMTVGPVDVPAGAFVGFKAILDGGTPTLKVKIR